MARLTLPNLDEVDPRLAKARLTLPSPLRRQRDRASPSHGEANLAVATIDDTEVGIARFGQGRVAPNHGEAHLAIAEGGNNEVGNNEVGLARSG